MIKLTRHKHLLSEKSINFPNFTAQIKCTMKIKYHLLSLLLISTFCSFFLSSCSDEDEPQLDVIDTSLVKIDAIVKATPTSQWLIPSE